MKKILGSNLETFLKAAKIIYTQNFTNEANYVYFGGSGEIWTSNISGDDIGTDEVILYGCLKNPWITNKGIPAKELHDILPALVNPVITTSDDHIVIESGKTKVKLKTVAFKEPPVTKISTGKWEPVPKIPTADNKQLLEFIDKNDVYGSKVHCDAEGCYTTDGNSIHLCNIPFPFDIAVNLDVWSVFPLFDNIGIDEDLLYLHNTADNIVLITKYEIPMDIQYLEDIMGAYDSLGEENNVTEFIVNESSSSDLIKSFMSSINKADRIIDVVVKDHEVQIIAEDYRKGSVDTVIATNVEHLQDVHFTIHPDKFFSCLKMGKTLRIIDDTLWVQQGSCDKFVKIERKDL